MRVRNLRHVAALLLLPLLVAAQPTVYQTAANAATAAGGVTTVTGPLPPAAGDEFVVCIENSTAPSMSGTWASITSIASYLYCYNRIVTSTDNANGATVTITTAAVTAIDLVDVEAPISNWWNGINASGTGSGLPFTASATATNASDLALLFGGGDGTGTVGDTACTTLPATPTGWTAGASVLHCNLVGPIGSKTADTYGTAVTYSDATITTGSATSETLTWGGDFNGGGLIAGALIFVLPPASSYQPIQVVGDPFWPLY